jgi:hypothetical protein
MYHYRNSRGGNRRMRGAYGFPWLLFFIFFFNFHSLAWFIISIGMIVLVSLIIRAVMSSTLDAGANMMGNSTQTPQTSRSYQQPYQQPYQSYEQGYQAPQETYNEGGQQYQYPASSEYDQYEQPQAQYPEQLPPMQQQ